MTKKQFIKKYGYHAYKILKNKEKREVFLSTVSQKNIYTESIGYFKSIANMFKDIINGTYKISIKGILSLLLSIAYIVIPADIILDVVPFIGFLDDITILLFLSAPIINEYRKYIAFKQTYEEVKKYHLQ